MRKTITFLLLLFTLQVHQEVFRYIEDNKQYQVRTYLHSFSLLPFFFISFHFFLSFLSSCLSPCLFPVRPSVLSSLPFCLPPYFLFLPPSSLSSSCTCTSLSPSSSPSVTTILIYSTQVLVTTPYFDQLVSHLVHSKNIGGLLLKTLEAQRYK